MAVDLPDKIRNAIEGPQFWALATTNPDGSPQVSTVWVNAKDGNILINSALGRKKPRNLEHEPRVALSWVDPENGYHTASIQGRVVETLHRRRGGSRHRLARPEVPRPVAVSVAQGGRAARLVRDRAHARLPPGSLRQTPARRSP